MGFVVNESKRTYSILVCQKLVEIPPQAKTEVPCLMQYEWNKLEAQAVKNSNDLDLLGEFVIVKANGYAYLPTGVVKSFHPVEVVVVPKVEIPQETVIETIFTDIKAIEEAEQVEEEKEAESFLDLLLKQPDPIEYLCENYTRAQLVDILVESQLDTKGNKKVLAQRLLDYIR